MKNLRNLAIFAVIAGLALPLDAGSVRAQPSSPAMVPKAEPSASIERATRAAEHTFTLDFEEARRELAAGDPESLVIATEKARLALYEGDCDAALALLTQPGIAAIEYAASLADISRGCARVTAATVVVRVPEAPEKVDIEMRFQDENDQAMAPIIAETIVKARDALTRDLGVTWPKPTRITIVRDLMSLSAMTGLPQEAAQTTGTVAVAKWGRVTLLSPRASHHGYAWRDTVAHELTHLAVTRATADRAPLWLQEGVAKREEIRWRDPGPYDDRPSPDVIVQRGVELKLDLPLDKLGPSIAMLPSADAAMVAFSEVTSFVRYLATTASPEALPRLLLALRQKKTVDAALVEASGADLKGWDTKWRAYIAARPKETLPALYGLGAKPPNLREVRERVRLAELLIGRSHPGEALAELDHIRGPYLAEALSDPSLRYIRVRGFEATSRGKEGEPLLAEPKDVVASYGPWWAIRGRWARVKNDDAVADASFVEAVAADPFDIESACQTLDFSKNPTDPKVKALCDAARHRNDPGLGQD